jgi:hypothetical protein
MSPLTGMAVLRPLLAVVFGLFWLLGCAAGGPVIGGAYYAPEYDWSEFFAVTDGRNFQVVMVGNPFPALPEAEVRRRLLPVMQAAKPRPNLTFTYEAPPERPRPYYRLVLIFNAANDLNADRVCAGEIRQKPEPTRAFDLYAIYCRNELPLSYTTAWTQATGPDDPRVEQLFAQLFLVLFPDQPLFRRGPIPVPFMRRW